MNKDGLFCFVNLRPRLFIRNCFSEFIEYTEFLGITEFLGSTKFIRNIPCPVDDGMEADMAVIS